MTSSRAWTQRNRGTGHDSIRRALLPQAYGKPCVRCGRPMLAGQRLELDHRDDRPGYLGFAHAGCNRSAGGRKGAARRWARREVVSMLDGLRVALGVEVSEDRRHTSIAAAGRLNREQVGVELVEYLDGTNDAVATVRRLHEVRDVSALVVAANGPAANLVGRFEQAGIRVEAASLSDVTAAHGEFRDLLDARRLRVTRSDVLRAAVKHGSERRFGQSTGWLRHETDVDMSPAIAVELAIWGLLSVRLYPEPDIF